MANFFPPPADFDTAAASELVWAAWRKGDFTQVTSRYGEQLNTTKIGARLAEIFQDQHVIRDRKQLRGEPDLAAWRDDIAEEFFGDEALLHSASTPEEEAARDKIVAQIWEYSSTSMTSPLNVALSQIGGFVLVQAKVAKKRPKAGMKGVAVPEPARFLTTDFELILEHAITAGELVKWRRATERFESVLKEIGYRQPDLTLSIAKAVAKEVPAVTGLLRHADVKAITAGRAEADSESEQTTDSGQA
jgi:hypothetical protein